MLGPRGTRRGCSRLSMARSGEDRMRHPSDAQPPFCESERRMMSELDWLEAQSIYILREAYNRIGKPVLLWSLGKDSNVMIWLAKKAFLGGIPFPVMHLDTGLEFPEVYAFRDRYGAEWSLNLIADLCPPIEETDPTLPSASRLSARKTLGLKQALPRYGFSRVIAGVSPGHRAS